MRPSARGLHRPLCDVRYARRVLTFRDSECSLLERTKKVGGKDCDWEVHVETDTFVVVLIGALVAGLALLLLVGAPADEATNEPLVLSETAAETPATGTYWQPVSGVTTASAPVTTPAALAPSSLTTSYPYAVGYEPTGGCSVCGSSAPRPTAPTPIVVPSAVVAMAGGCGVPIEPCGQPSCEIPYCSSVTPMYCGGCPSMACPYPVCGGVRPQINRNAPLCVDECSFIQLHASVPQPVCLGVRFEWSATKGHFLDPTAADPIYFAPATFFPGGEDVWITLAVTDAQGIRYTDQVKLHVGNIR